MLRQNQTPGQERRGEDIINVINKNKVRGAKLKKLSIQAK